MVRVLIRDDRARARSRWAMLRWTMAVGLVLGSWLAGGCGDDDGGDGPGHNTSSATGKNPSSSGTAASGMTETIGVAGGNSGNAGNTGPAVDGGTTGGQGGDE